MGPIFVVGNSRSGTTMMAQILGRHEAVFAFNELHFFEQIWSPADQGRAISRNAAIALFARLLAVQRIGFLEASDGTRFYQEAAAALDKVIGLEEFALTAEEVFKHFLLYEAKLSGKLVPLEQTPRNVFYLQEILRIFPEAKVINMVRDPRAVMLSQKSKWKLRGLGLDKIPLREAVRAWANYHPFVIAKLWCAGIHAARERDCLDSNTVLNVTFEKLVGSPADTVGEICRWLNLSYDPNMLCIPYWGSSRERTEKGRSGIQSSAAAGWRRGGLSAAELEICQRVTFPVARQFGYDPEAQRGVTGVVVLLFLLLPFKLTLAFLLNLHRMKNIGETIRRRLSIS